MVREGSAVEIETSFLKQGVTVYLRDNCEDLRRKAFAATSIHLGFGHPHKVQLPH